MMCQICVVHFMLRIVHSQWLFLTWMFTLGGFTAGFRLRLKQVVSCEILRLGYRFKNRIKPVIDRNKPEEALMEL